MRGQILDIKTLTACGLIKVGITLTSSEQNYSNGGSHSRPLLRPLAVCIRHLMLL